MIEGLVVTGLEIPGISHSFISTRVLAKVSSEVGETPIRSGDREDWEGGTPNNRIEIASLILGRISIRIEGIQVGVSHSQMATGKQMKHL